MRFAATFAVVLCAGVVLVARAGAQVPTPAPIAVDIPQPAVPVFAQRLNRRQLTAVVEVA